MIGQLYDRLSSAAARSYCRRGGHVPGKVGGGVPIGAEGVNVGELDIRIYANARTVGHGFGVVFTQQETRAR